MESFDVIKSQKHEPVKITKMKQIGFETEKIASGDNVRICSRLMKSGISCVNTGPRQL